MLPRRREIEERPVAVAPSTIDPHARVDELLRRFREPVVRLVERVTDELGPPASPVAETQRDIRLVRSAFGKWSAELLIALHAKPAVGFEELRRTLVGISARVLSIKLKELEENGMIRREVLDARPPRVRYSLTERGWTVAWLARPILLYLRVTELPSSATPMPAAGGGAFGGPSVAPMADAPRSEQAVELVRPSGRSQPDGAPRDRAEPRHRAPPRRKRALSVRGARRRVR
jgi:DNA-binding HxlR family transcriptional regulator